jgi:hypothetical protein
MAGHQRSFFPVPGGDETFRFYIANTLAPPVNQPFMSLSAQFAVNQSMQQSFIAQNNMLAAQAAVATANVPTSIFRLGAKGNPPTPVLGVSRFQDQRASSATNTPNDDDYEWLEYFNSEGKPYYHNRITKVTTWAKPDHFKPGDPKTGQKVCPKSVLFVICPVFRQHLQARLPSAFGKNTKTRKDEVITTIAKPKKQHG